MATWTDFNKIIWIFDDDKLDFDAWVSSNSGVVDSWKQASNDYRENPADSKAGEIFGQWIAYANAVEEQFKNL